MELINNYQVPEGYKKTEIGVIPEDWEVVPLKDLIDADRRITYGIVVPGQHTSNGVPMIRAQDYSRGWVDIEDLYRVSPKIDESYKRSRVIPDDILLTIVGSVGNLAKVPSGFRNTNITQQTARLAFNKKAFADFYFNILQSKLGKNVILNYTKSGVQPSLNLSDVEKFNLPYPPLREQKAIAQTLSDVDALIAALDKHIAKKRNIKTGTMQQLLTGKTRLPGFGGSWKTMLFLEIAWCRKERIDPRKSGTQEFCVELEHIESGTGRLLGNTQTGDQSSLKAVFQPGDVLFGKLRSYLQKYWIADREGVCSTEIWVLAANARLVISKFLYQVVTTEQFINAASNAYGTHMPRSDWNIVKNYKVAVPPLPEQKAIAKVLFDIDTEITALEKRRAKTQAIKQGMMQELLTGRTRLKIEHPDDPITKNSNG